MRPAIFIVAAAALLAAAAADLGVRFAPPGANATRFPPASATIRRTDEVKPTAVPPPWLDRNNVCRPQRAARGANIMASVCDPSSLLSEHQIDDLAEPLANMFAGRDPYALVRCPDNPSSKHDDSGPLAADATGFRVAVLVVRRMPYDSRTLSARAEAFAHTVFQRWGMSGNCGASVLLFVSVDDRRMYMQTGRLATNYLNTHQVDAIFKLMTPYMRKQRLFPALKTAVDRVGFYIGHYHGRHPRARHSHGAGSNDPLFLRDGPAWWDLEMSLVVVALAACLVCACCNGLGGPEATQRKRDRRTLLRKLEVVRMEYVRAALPHYTPSTCPVCCDDVGRPFVPAVPALPGDESAPLTRPDDDAAADRPTRTLRSGMIFHRDCFDRVTDGKASDECPVTGVRAGGTTPPPAPAEMRLQDLEFRLRHLRAMYPRLLTDPVMAKLAALTPDMWPDTLTDAFLSPHDAASRAASRGAPYQYGGDGDARYGYDDRGYGYGGHGDSGGGSGGLLGTVGGLLAAGGVGALIGSALSGGNGGGNDEQHNGSGYSNIGAGPLPSWYVGSGGDGAPAGAGHGAAWTDDADGGNEESPAWLNGGSGQGAGWEVDGEAGHGAGWGDDGGDDDGGGDGDGDGAGF